LELSNYRRAFFVLIQFYVNTRTKLRGAQINKRTKLRGAQIRTKQYSANGLVLNKIKTFEFNILEKGNLLFRATKKDQNAKTTKTG